MQTTVEQISGETDGVTWRVPVLRFSPRPGASGPLVYLQAALHANGTPAARDAETALSVSGEA